MEVSVTAAGELIKISLKGELDHHMAKAVSDKIERFMSGQTRTKMLFDFKGVSFMDSSGVGMVIGRHKRFQKHGGRIGVINLNERVRRIFEMSGLFNIVSFFENEKDAIDEL